MTTFLKNHKKKIIYISSILSIILILIIANMFANFIIPTQTFTTSISSNSFQMYLISLSKSQIESEAKSHSADFQEIGGGGYIWKQDDYYHIIASAYLNKADAELVQNSIKLNQNLTSEILTISFNNYTIYGNFSSEENKVISDLLSACTNFYSSIYDIAISLDTSVCNEISAKLAVNSAHHDFSTTIANFNTIFSPHLPSNLSPVYALALKGYKIGEKLVSGELINTNQNYSSLLKYRYLEIMNLYYNFCLEEK